MNKGRLLTAALSLALVGGVATWEWRHLTSPGPLHPSHAAVGALGGRTGCAVCHGAHAGAMGGACLACHSEIGEQVRTAGGLHGSLGGDAAACSGCHAEHGGARLPLVTGQSFRGAGIQDVDTYDHWHVAGFDLEGRHDELACDTCHALANAGMLREGQRRFTGLSRACASCHRDPHEGSFGASCAACHGQAGPFKEAPSFSHESFVLQGAHAGVACRRCHDVAGPTAVATLHARAFIPRSCVGCHEDAHEGALGTDCASCHGTERPFNQAARFTHTAEFPLSGGHGGIACRDCHAKDTAYGINALRDNPRSPRECVDCHASPHRPSTVAELALADRIPEAATCVLCHSPANTTFLGGVEGMTPTRHRATGFSLGPPHDRVTCAACHPGLGKGRSGGDPAGFARLFPGRSADDCASCHGDPHEGQFDGGPTLGRCIACHEATHFNPSIFDSSAHSRSTFPLGGAHRAVACALCHREDRGVRRFATTPTQCASCHEDVHAGRFEGPTRPRSVGGRTGCARCHNDTAFTAVDWTAAQHGRWTGYELRGGHAAAACTECHRRASRPDARGMSLGVAPQSCNACHADPHAGQFARGNSTDCARCHVDSAPFTATTFDHERDSEFRLDEHHATLACAACHKAAKSPQGATVTRYRPLGTTCKDCHGSGTPKARGGT